MFQRTILENKIPPNFLNSILTNDSLYLMFRDNFDENIEYFNNIPLDDYLYSLNMFICEQIKSGSISNLKIKEFYDDFILPNIKNNELNIFSTSFFKYLYQNRNNLIELYTYVFDTSNYSNTLNKFIAQIRETRELDVKSYEVLSNYIKNGIDDYIDIDIVLILIHDHVYRKNHLFDVEVIKKILSSILHDYFLPYQIDINIEYETGISLNKVKKTHDLDSKTIYIDEMLINTFISGNYVELLSNLFYKMNLFRDDYLIHNNYVDINTLHTIWRMVNLKVDIDKVFSDSKYKPYGYFSDMEASSFIMALRFLESANINLVDNYIKSSISSINFDEVSCEFSKKEISSEMQFTARMIKSESVKMEALMKYDVISLFYLNTGKRKKAIDLLNISKNKYRDVIFEYLHSSIPEATILIDDVIDLSGYKFNYPEIDNFVERLLKYIYTDTFYYSVDNYIKLNTGKMSFNKDNYLSDLYIRISCIKDTPITHRFIDNALNILDDMKQ